jgi:hypothetical protein
MSKVVKYSMPSSGSEINCPPYGTPATSTSIEEIDAPLCKEKVYEDDTAKDCAIRRRFIS